MADPKTVIEADPPTLLVCSTPLQHACEKRRLRAASRPSGTPDSGLASPEEQKRDRLIRSAQLVRCRTEREAESAALSRTNPTRWLSLLVDLVKRRASFW